jgi:hypothetical protein
MKNSQTKSGSPPQTRSKARPSDVGPLAIIYTGARKAFKVPAWIIRTSTRPAAAFAA